MSNEKTSKKIQPAKATKSKTPAKSSKKPRQASDAELKQNVATWVAQESDAKEQAKAKHKTYVTKKEMLGKATEIFKQTIEVKGDDGKKSKVEHGKLYTLKTIAAICGKESQFCNGKLGTRQMAGAAGYFKLEKATAQKYLTINSKTKVDERFDLERSAQAAAQHLMDLDAQFIKDEIKVPVKDEHGNVILDSKGRPKSFKKISNPYIIKNDEERKKFVLAAYNVGESKVKRAVESLRKENEKNLKKDPAYRILDPLKWENVKSKLTNSGGNNAEIYVHDVEMYEQEFNEWGGHWVTLDDGRHVLIV